MQSQSIFLIACEASGDLHGAHLIREMKQLNPALHFTGLGGPQMQKEGMHLIYDMTKISALGLGDVIRQYGTYRKIFYQALDTLKESPHNALILIDSPGFNLRFAKKARQMFPKLTIFYYICPQIWAWGQRRVHVVRKTIDKLFSILPFEKDFYSQFNIHCEFVGHPLLDHEEALPGKEALRKSLGMPVNSMVIGLLPGSRPTEVKRIFPIMLKSAEKILKEFPTAQFWVASASHVPESFYRSSNSSSLPLHFFTENFKGHVAALDFALVTSGTATLQTALAGTPFFLLYKASWSTYFLGKWLIRVPYLGLVNLLSKKPVVPEFIQMDAKPDVIAQEAIALLRDPNRYREMKEEFQKVRVLLGRGGASHQAAQSMLAFLADRDKTS